MSGIQLDGAGGIVIHHQQINLTHFQVVAVLGPRQVGKTTLARQMEGQWPESVRHSSENFTHIGLALQDSPDYTIASVRGPANETTTGIMFA